jgi:membrane associated rhomboid family serine protease
MIPLRDLNPTSSRPVLTVMLLLANILAFAVDMLTGHQETLMVETAQGVVRTSHMVGGLAANYALVPARLLEQTANAWPTIFSSMFLHGNLFHLGSNMLFLWIFGNNIEDALGRMRFALFYALCGLTAGLAQTLSAPASTIPMVGASGAVAGIMGAYLVLYPKARIITLIPLFFVFTTIEVPAFLMIGYWALLQIISANWFGGGELQGGVAYFAHIGGFLGGILFLRLLGGWPRFRRQIP